MLDPLALTIIFIALTTIVGAVIKRIHKDKCIKDFKDDTVTLEEMSGKVIWGKLRIENTGLELIYPAKHKDDKGHSETSYILYKYEYPNIQALIRFHDQLTAEQKKSRDQDLDRTYHPSALRRSKRKFLNCLRTVRDALAEVANLLLSRAKKSTAVGSTLTSQDKYVSQIKQELVGSVGTSYEPLLERYIGSKVVLELAKGEAIIEYPGVLKDYTSEFIEIMDVDYKVEGDAPPKKADIVVLRKYALIRHLAE